MLNGNNWIDVSNKSTQATEKKELLPNNHKLQNNGSRNNPILVNKNLSQIYINKPKKAEELSSERFTNNNIKITKSKNSYDQNKRPFPSERNICKDFQLNSIFIPLLVCRNSPHLTRKIKSENVILEKLCQSNGFRFIHNSNINK